MQLKPALDRYCDFFEQLVPSDIERFNQIYAPNARFKDPFHDVCELTLIQTIFAHMFSVAPDARFIIQQRFVNADSAMIIWTLTMTVREQALIMTGSTHLVFDEQGLVTLHRDYWDTGEELFSKLPYIGAPTRWLMRQFSVI